MIVFVLELEGIDPEKMVPYFRKMLVSRLNTFGKRIAGFGTLGLGRHLQRAGGYAPNSIIWKIGGKGGKRVFYDSGVFRRMARHEVKPPVGDEFGSVTVGFLDDVPHPGSRGGISVKKLAQVISNGTQWSPTPAQRKAFWAGIDKNLVKNKISDRPKNQWTIPSRDFVSKHLSSEPVKAEFVKMMDRITQRYMKEKVRKR